MNLTKEVLKEAMGRGLNSDLSTYIESWRKKYSAEDRLRLLLAGDSGECVLVGAFPISNGELSDLDSLAKHMRTVQTFVNKNKDKWVNWYFERRTREVNDDGTVSEEPFIVDYDTYEGFHTYGENWIIYATLKPDHKEMDSRVKALRAHIAELDERMDCYFNAIMSTLTQVELEHRQG